MSGARGVRWAALVALVMATLSSPWDRDRDGFLTTGALPHDCDDRSASVRPGAPEVPLDGIDQDCDGHDSGAGSNVLLISVDTVRARNLGAYGYERDTSPNIDALAARGALFRSAYASSSWTIPSLGSIFTARHPAQHGAVTGRVGLVDDLETLTEIVDAEGYATSAFVHSAFPLLTMGFAQGFDHIQRGAGKAMGQVIRWLTQHHGERFFMWVHFAEPHTPYFPKKKFQKRFAPVPATDRLEIRRFWDKEECRQRYEDSEKDNELRIAFYDEVIRESDEYIGRLLTKLEELGVADRTLVVLSSDHGEEFFEHRGCDHGQTLYDEVLHVPLVFRHPGVIDPGVVVDEQVRIIDIFPTVLDVLDLEVDEQVPGRSLLPHIRGRARDLPLIGGFLSSAAPAVVIRHQGYKYIYSKGRGALRQKADRRAIEELYDLEADPDERHDLAAAGHPRVQNFRRKAERWLVQKRPKGKRQNKIDAATERRLRALGYLGGDAPPKPAVTKRRPANRGRRRPAKPGSTPPARRPAPAGAARQP